MYEITVKYTVPCEDRPTARDVEDDLRYALGRLTELGCPSEIQVLSILHPEEEFLAAMEAVVAGQKGDSLNTLDGKNRHR